MALDLPQDGQQEEDGPDLIPRPKDFHHPYTPYDIQEAFMGTVYQVLQDGKVGILESPTGTVSTFILNNALFTWLYARDRIGSNRRALYYYTDQRLGN